jgi:hypothetical protein
VAITGLRGRRSGGNGAFLRPGIGVASTRALDPVERAMPVSRCRLARIAVVGALAASTLGPLLHAQEAAETAGADSRTGSDAVEPEYGLADDLDPTRLVFFNLRLIHAELGDDARSDILLLRRDLALRRPKRWGPGDRVALLRFDLPAGRVRLGGEEREGLGDLYAQALRVHRFSDSFVLNYGPAFHLPTATDDALGTGKWQATPTLVPTWQLPKLRGLAYVRIQDSFSFAGDEERADIHHLIVNGSFAKMLTRRTFFLLETEAVVDWEDEGRINWKSGLTWGGLVRRGRVGWLKLVVPWGEQRRGEWLLTASIVLRRRAESAPPRAEPRP